MSSESEERRKELVRKSRTMSDKGGFIPAIHPRYSNLYNELYGEENDRKSKSTLGIRMLLGFAAFACYVWMDHAEVPVGNIYSSQIVNQIEKNIDMDDVKAVWKEL